MPYALLLLINAINLLTIISTSNLNSSANLLLITKSTLSIIRIPVFTIVLLVVIIVVIIIIIILIRIIIVVIVVIIVVVAVVLLLRFLLLIRAVIL